MKILNLYGNYKINKIYLIRNYFGKLVAFLLNMITLYKYDTIIKNKEKVLPYHYSIIIEILLPNGKEKLLLLEKTNTINICENFIIKNINKIKKVNLNKYNYTIIEILNNTKKRIGDVKFFNYSYNKNNCMNFTKEILKTIKKYNKTNKKYFFSNESINKFAKEINLTIFNIHIMNSIINIFNIFNIIEQFIYNIIFI
jgi:hypothetical protein